MGIRTLECRPGVVLWNSDSTIRRVGSVLSTFQIHSDTVSLADAVVMLSICQLVFNFRFSVASLFTFTLNCLVISFALALSLGISDFCTQPRPFLHSTVEGNLSRWAIDFYLECRSDAVPIEHPLAKVMFSCVPRLLVTIAHSIPFQFESAVDNTVISMQKQLKVVESDLDTLKKSSQVHFHVSNLHTHLNEALKNFGNIEELLSCDGIHTAYRKAFDGLCTSGL